AVQQREQADDILAGATDILVELQNQMDMKSNKRVFALLQRGAEHGDTTSIGNLGIIYENGYGVAQDYAEAHKWYKKAADKGDARAMRELGVLYADGSGVTQDYIKARERYRKAA